MIERGYWISSSGWDLGVHSIGKQAADGSARDKMLRCPVDLAEYPGQSLRAMPRPQQRTDQSIILHYTRRMGRSSKTHEEKHPVGVPFPSVCHLTVLFPSATEIHREQSFRTIGKVGLCRQALILLGRNRNGRVPVVIYRRE